MTTSRIVFFDLDSSPYRSARLAQAHVPTSVFVGHVSKLEPTDRVFVFEASSFDALQGVAIFQLIPCVQPGDTTFLSLVEAAPGPLLVASEAMHAALSPAARQRSTVLSAVGPQIGHQQPDVFETHALQPRVVIVDGLLLEESSPTSLLLQLSLVSQEVTWLFDVGEEVRLAKTLRREAPFHEVDAAMFALSAAAPQYYSNANAAICRPHGRVLAWATALGLPYLVVGERSVFVPATKLPMLAVDFEAMSQTREDLAPWSERFEAALAFTMEFGAKLATGLPEGIERIEQRRGDTEAKTEATPSPSVEAELQALKDAIKSGQK